MLNTDSLANKCILTPKPFYWGKGGLKMDGRKKNKFIYFRHGHKVRI